MQLQFNTTINPLSILGLLIDMVGIYILYKNGIPSPIEEAKSYLIINDDPAKEMAISKRVRKNARIGLIFIFIGFFFQLVGSIIIVSV